MAILGIIADDFTGATDIAGMLVKGGMRTIQTIGLPAQGTIPDDVDAVVVALKTRSIPAQDAITQSLGALKALQAAGCERFFFKYCSTFNSTDQGNIGPVGDALLDSLASRQAIYCPAFPENGRTIFFGHLFVGDLLLSDTHMRHHPLNPMTDSSLVRVLARQTKHKVGLVPLKQVQAGSAALRSALDKLAAEGVRHVIVDAVADTDLGIIGEAVGDDVLVERRLGRGARPACCLSPAQPAGAQVRRRRPAQGRRGFRGPGGILLGGDAGPDRQLQGRRIWRSTPTRSAAASRSATRRWSGPRTSSATVRSCCRPATSPRQ